MTQKTEAQAERFATTHWSVIAKAKEHAIPGSGAALERLCRTYWYPLYSFVRREGYDDESAKDLTQGFFARFLEKNYLGQTQRERGKFRSFLLASLKHFLSDERDKVRAQKRGGGKTFVSFDDLTADERYRLEPVDAIDAEKLFERRWALTLLDQARHRLKVEYARRGKSALYNRLAVFEHGDINGPTYAEMADELRLTENAVKSAVFRMRQRYHELVRESVAQTVGNRAEIDEEIRYLIRVISG